MRVTLGRSGAFMAKLFLDAPGIRVILNPRRSAIVPQAVDSNPIQSSRFSPSAELLIRALDTLRSCIHRLKYQEEVIKLIYYEESRI
jgi:hypothetical protein